MSAQSDDEFVDRLAAMDEAMADGHAPIDLAVNPLPNELQNRLKRGLAALQALRHVRSEIDILTIHAHDAPTLGAGKPGPAPMHFGRFHIIRELGRGGFGIVFLARDPKLHRDVALKVPHAQAVMDSGMRERFRREAQAAAGLDHPNIVAVYEVDEQGPICALVSAYCPSITLAEWLARHKTPVEPKAAAQIVADLAGAVAYAHSKGVLHRDLKPANVLVVTVSQGDLGLTSDALASVKITDFGLAKLADDPSPMTRTGAVIGTPAYMAPEQARGKNEEVDVRADVYALGCILYEILSGRPPFRGESDVDTLKLVCETEPITPRQLRPRLPRDLETVCLKCLEKDPGQRYGNVAQLQQDLARFLNGEPVLARPIGPVARAWRWCRRHPAVSGLSAALLTAIALGSTGMFVAYGQVRQERNTALEERNAATAERDRNGRFLNKARGSIQELIDQGHKLVHDPSTVREGLEMLEVGRRYYTNLLKEDPNDRPLRQQAVLICKRLGLIYCERQDTQAGQNAWAEAIDHAEQLIDGPDGEKYQQEYFDVIANWAELLMVAGKFDDVFLITERPLQLARANCAARPEDHEAGWQLHASVLFRGMSAKRAKRWADADASLREGLAAVRKFGPRFGVPQHMTIEANYLCQLAAVAIFDNRLEEGLELATAAVAVSRLAVAPRPDDLNCKRALAASLSQLGRAHYNKFDWQGTIDAFREANDLFTANWAWSRFQPGSYFEVALGTKLISDSLDKLNRREEGIPYLKKLIELEPTDIKAGGYDAIPADVIECYSRLAALYFIRGDLEEAKRVHAEGMTKLEAVTNKTPDYDKPERWMKAVGEKIAGKSESVEQ